MGEECTDTRFVCGQVRYLSAAPEGITEVLLTGGLPPSVGDPNGTETAYQRLYRCTIPCPIVVPQSLSRVSISKICPTMVGESCMHAFAGLLLQCKQEAADIPPVLKRNCDERIL